MMYDYEFREGVKFTTTSISTCSKWIVSSPPGNESGYLLFYANGLDGEEIGREWKFIIFGMNRPDCFLDEEGNFPDGCLP